MEKESGKNRLTAKIIAFIGSSFAECRGNAKRKEHSAESRSIDFFSHQFSFSVFTAPRSSLLAPCSLLLDDFVCSSQHIRRASRIPSARVDSVFGSVFDRYPIRGTFFGCCASALTSR